MIYLQSQSQIWTFILLFCFDPFCCTLNLHSNGSEIQDKLQFYKRNNHHRIDRSCTNSKQIAGKKSTSSITNKTNHIDNCTYKFMTNKHFLSSSPILFLDVLVVLYKFCQVDNKIWRKLPLTCQFLTSFYCIHFTKCSKNLT